MVIINIVKSTLKKYITGATRLGKNINYTTEPTKFFNPVFFSNQHIFSANDNADCKRFEDSVKICGINS